LNNSSSYFLQVIFGTDLVLALWKSFFGIEEQLKRSNSEPHLQKLSDEEPYFWPPPPDERQVNERTHIRKALGQNIDNSMITQDFLHKLIRPHPNRPAPRYEATASAPAIQNEANEASEALIRSVNSSPVKVQANTGPGTPSGSVINR
ncbi:hypothetical protein OESDEN_12359, partial [Oesophagostomum dentatum]